MAAQILIDNVRETQAFDQLLKRGSKLQRLTAQYAKAVMFEPDETRRNAAIGKVQSAIVEHFREEVQPSARTIGIRQARAVIASIGGVPPGDLNDEAFRRRILFDSTIRAEDRLRIVQTIVNDKANTLSNRLAAHWLEPGRKPGDKLVELQTLHNEQEKQLTAYNAKLAAWESGGGEGNRPTRPRLDFYARFSADVTQGVREQGRRTATDAEHSVFQAAGHKLFSWVTVNASQACVDCRRRQGVTGTMEWFEAEIGKPGSGGTVCGSSCFCILVPSETVRQQPGLSGGLVVPPVRAGAGGKDTPADVAAIAAAKVEPQAAAGEDVPPKGVPVSRMMKVEARAVKVREAITKSAAAIDRVHTVEGVQPLPFKSNTTTNANGRYSYRISPGGRHVPEDIAVSVHSTNPHTTTAHEIGHWIDNQAVPGTFGQTGRGYASVDNPDLAGWRAAVSKSKAFAEMKKLLDAPPPGVHVDARYIRYNRQTHEAFARSYAQWVARRSGDADMQREIEAQRQPTRAGFNYWKQWADDDFEPIAAELDKFFGKLGWLQKAVNL